MTDWTSRVVDDLLQMKRAGVAFDQAWMTATRIHKPSARQLAQDGGTLFDEAGDANEPFAEFFYRACRDAWHGEKPELAALPRLMDGMGDFSTDARKPRGGRRREIKAQNAA
jgi:hypothetical protein